MKTIELQDVQIDGAQLIKGMGAWSIIYPNSRRFKRDYAKVKSKGVQKNKSLIIVDEVRIILEAADKRISVICDDSQSATYLFFVAYLVERSIKIVPVKN